MRDPLDALQLDALEVDLRAEGDGREDRQLVRRVDAADVELRIGLEDSRARAPPRRPRRREARRPPSASGCSCRCRSSRPITRVIALPASPSVRALTQGMPPATAASNRSGASFASASSARACPCRAIIALLAVTTGLPAASAASVAALAGPSDAAHQLDEQVDVVAPRQGDGIVLPGVARQVDAAVAVAAAGRDGGDRDGAAGARRQQVRGWSCTMRTTPTPTVPRPAMPRRREGVMAGLRAW